MPVFIRAALAAGLFLAASQAAAQSPSAMLWLCHLDDEAVRLVCVADAESPQATAATASVSGTRFPLDPAQQWTVELWTPPSDMEFVSELARATICYRSPGCSVTVLGPRETRAISRPVRASRPGDGRAG